LKLKLAEGLSLPLEVVTQKLAWLGVTGSGKTYGASKLAELLFHAGAQFVAIDPVGVWWGVRLDKGGKKPSTITVPVFGGLHGDVPLEPTGGALLANLIVDKALSAIVDVSQFESDAAKARFAADFADRLFQRRKAAPAAMHLFLEECQEFVPQNPQRGDERMLHVFTRMQKLGRNYGIGSSYISQRPQEVNKKALNMAQTLFVFRTTGVHERKAIEAWVHDKALDQDIAGDLPKIATGHCHVWSPEFLEVSHQVHILPKETFNASATPEVGAAAVARELAPTDLAQIAKDMAATIEKAKADDPRELRKQIAELKRQLSSTPVTLPTERKAISTPVLTDADRALLEKVAAKIAEAQRLFALNTVFDVDDLWKQIDQRIARFKEDLKNEAADGRAEFIRTLESKGFQQILGKLSALSPQPPAPDSRRPAGPRAALPTGRSSAATRPNETRAPRGTDGSGAAGDIKLNRLAERKVLQVLVQHGERTKQQLAIQSGYAASGGGFNGALSKLKGAGFITTNGSGTFHVTDAGAAAIGDVKPLPTGAALVSYWMQQFNRLAEREVLRVIVEAYPSAITAEDIAARTNPPYEPKGGGFNGALSKLRTLGLITGRGELRASEELFSGRVW